MEPAALYRSEDSGQVWEPVKGLNEHPTRSDWWPGGGGLCLHTILFDPRQHNRMYVGISVAGVFRSDDGGRTWTPRNEGTYEFEFPKSQSHEIHRCTHKCALNPKRPQTLSQQNHEGVYRSDDYGDSWTDISDGLPSKFGFPIAILGNDPDTVYVTPGQQDVQGERFPKTVGQLTLCRTRDGGHSWQSLTKGLPDDVKLNVYRDGMASDALEPGGVYFGTSAGVIYCSTDEGDTWKVLADGLPGVRFVKAVQGEGGC